MSSAPMPCSRNSVAPRNGGGARGRGGGGGGFVEGGGGLKGNVVSADALLEELRGPLKWEWVAGLGASERRFDEVVVRLASSGADLVGYLNYIHPYRVQI